MGRERTTDLGTEKILRIEREYVQQQIADIVKNQDLSRCILQSMAQMSDVRRTMGPLDVALILVLALASVFALRPSIHSVSAPTEDAAMLLRYSQHVAAGTGVTWNVGEHPVEGATDFLYMLTVGGVTKLTHGDAVLASRELQFACLVLLPLIVFACVRFTLNVNRWIAVGLALYVFALPGRWYILSCFGAPFLMLIVALTWWVGVAMIAGKVRVSAPWSLAFSLMALLMGLTRPEANVMAALMLAAIVSVVGLQNARALVATFALVFVLLGGAYFVWRLHYFGYLLPNPFYVKGGGHFHLQGLGNGAENVMKLVWPMVPVMLLALRTPQRVRMLRALMVVLCGYTAIWILLSNENNALFRFQMPVLPVALMFVPLLLQGLLDELPLPWDEMSAGARRGFVSAVTFYVLAACYIFTREFSPPVSHNSGQELAEYLRGYADRGYAIATTEAGTFPYFSQWTSIDLLGLNDVTIAHHGLSEEYLDRYKPEVILYHLYPETGGGWMHRDTTAASVRDHTNMAVARAYAKDHGYVLAAAYGSDACSLHYFWVRPGTSDTDAIVSHIRDTPYYFLDTGALSRDYRNGTDPSCQFTRWE